MRQYYGKPCLYDELRQQNYNMYQDKVTLDRIEKLHPLIREEAHQIYKEICERLKGRVVVRFTSTLRTIVEQNGIFAQGRTKPGKVVTWAKGGFSWHNYGLAIDICLLRDTDGNGTFDQALWDNKIDIDGDGKADWMEVVEIFDKYGWEWGGRWAGRKRDTPHFQKTMGYTITEVRKLHSNGYIYLAA